MKYKLLVKVIKCIHPDKCYLYIPLRNNGIYSRLVLHLLGTLGLKLYFEIFNNITYDNAPFLWYTYR